MRINKLFSNLGICSRKETNKLIEEKRIKINGELCTAFGQWVEDDDEILLDDEKISMMERVYIAFNKPVGITCTSEKGVKDNIIDFINYKQYIFPVGRLDKDSQGLIILTNDGDLANSILEAENDHEKEYIVTVDKAFDDEFIMKMIQGVDILGNESSGVKRISDELGVLNKDGHEEVISLNRINSHNKDNKFKKRNLVKTKPCKVSRVNHDTFKITLTQGLNRQIRKMSGALGYKVIKLERIRIMNINLENLKYGEYRNLSLEELSELKKLACDANKIV